MKILLTWTGNRRRSLGLAFLSAALAGAGCDTRPQVEDDADFEQAVEQRVEMLMLEEELAELEAQLAEREVAGEEEAAEPTPVESATAAATPAPEPATQSAPAAQPAPARAVAATPTVQPNYGVFYEELSPYGTWLQTDHYGYVWQPRVAYRSSAWRPYSLGHWVYTDVGWMWVSDEPFGWAVYHYGRWVYLSGRGWCWVPGYEWAPAWVSWRYSDRYIGWAPLAPEIHFTSGRISFGISFGSYLGPSYYCFVPTQRFGSRRINRHLLPRHESLTIINQTTNITNIVQDNRTIINNGPDYGQVQRLSSDRIRTAEVRWDRNRRGSDRGYRWTGDRELTVATAGGRSDRRDGRRNRPDRFEQLGNVERHSGWEDIEDPDLRNSLEAQWANESNTDVEHFRQARAERLRRDGREARIEGEARRRVAERQVRGGRRADSELQTQSSAARRSLDAVSGRAQHEEADAMTRAQAVEQRAREEFERRTGRRVPAEVAGPRERQVRTQAGEREVREETRERERQAREQAGRERRVEEEAVRRVQQQREAQERQQRQAEEQARDQAQRAQRERQARDQAQRAQRERQAREQREQAAQRERQARDQAQRAQRERQAREQREQAAQRERQARDQAQRAQRERQAQQQREQAAQRERQARDQAQRAQRERQAREQREQAAQRERQARDQAQRAQRERQAREQAGRAQRGGARAERGEEDEERRGRGRGRQ